MGRAIPDVFAVFTVDPGGTSGVARGVFKSLPTLADTLREAVKMGEVEAWECEGAPELQAWELAAEIRDWVFEVHTQLLIPLPDISVVFEAFQLRQRSADLSPVAVTAATCALLMDRDDVMSVEGWSGTFVGGVGLYVQQPADAKNLATRERLIDWDLYALGRGSDHKRDALRHLAVRVNGVLG